MENQYEENKQVAQHEDESLPYPLRKLPPEILCQIFGLCYTESRVGKDKDCPIIHISHVCSHWRKVARSSPSLWARISVDLSTYTNDLDEVMPMLSMHLSLSQQCPLHLTLDLPNDTAVSWSTFESIASHCSRWETVSLNVTPRILTHPKFAMIKNNLPSLRSMELWPRFVENLDGDATLDLFTNAPMLQSIVLGRIAPLHGHINVLLPWSQFSNVTLSLLDISDVYKQLRLASGARKITLDRCDGLIHRMLYRFSSPALGPPLLLSTVESLSICGEPPDCDFLRFYERFTLPRLTSLELMAYEDHRLPGESINRDTLSFLARSGCTLTSLSLLNLSSTSIDILHLLRGIPSLLNLTIYETRFKFEEEKNPVSGHGTGASNYTITEAFLRQMTISASDVHNFYESNAPLLLPCLQFLSFRPRIPFHTPSFIRMVQSRCVPNPESVSSSEMGALGGLNGLKKVELRFVGSTPEDLLEGSAGFESLQALEIHGLRFLLLPPEAALEDLGYPVADGPVYDYF